MLAKVHSNKFVYDDFFETFKSKEVDVLKKQLGVKRVIGYTYRADYRPVEIPWESCNSDWKLGFTLTDPISNKIINYPAHPEGIGCGIKDVGGFFPTFTKKEDIEKIYKMLIEYKKKTGKNFDPFNNNLIILLLLFPPCR